MFNDDDFNYNIDRKDGMKAKKLTTIFVFFLFFIVTTSLVNAEYGIITNGTWFNTTDLVSYHRFEESGTLMNDSSGNAYNCNYGGTLQQQPGKLGFSLGFDGVNDQCLNNTYYNFAPSGLTAAGWIYIANSSVKGTLAKIGDANDGFGIGTGTNNFQTNGNEVLGLYETVRWLDSNTAMGVGWNHIAITIGVGNTTNPELWLNGTSLGKFSGIGMQDPNTELRIGGYTSRFFGGEIDE